MCCSRTDVVLSLHRVRLQTDAKPVDIMNDLLDSCCIQLVQHCCSSIFQTLLECIVAIVVVILHVGQDIIYVEYHVVGPSKTCCPTVGLEDVGNVAIELQMHLLSYLTWAQLVHLVELDKC